MQTPENRNHVTQKKALGIKRIEVQLSEKEREHLGELCKECRYFYKNTGIPLCD